MMNCYHTFRVFFYPDLRVGEVEIAHWMVMVTDEIFPRSLLPEEGVGGSRYDKNHVRTPLQ